jgi:hypothetical protein
VSVRCGRLREAGGGYRDLKETVLLADLPMLEQLWLEGNPLSTDPVRQPRLGHAHTPMLHLFMLSRWLMRTLFACQVPYVLLLRRLCHALLLLPRCTTRLCHV